MIDSFVKKLKTLNANVYFSKVVDIFWIMAYNIRILIALALLNISTVQSDQTAFASRAKRQRNGFYTSVGRVSTDVFFVRA